MSRWICTLPKKVTSPEIRSYENNQLLKPKIPAATFAELASPNRLAPEGDHATFVEQHNGRIWALAELGRGAIFFKLSMLL
jgi:hypothetical protein